VTQFAARGAAGQPTITRVTGRRWSWVAGVAKDLLPHAQDL